MSSGKPSVYDVATAAEVSTASVSRYFRSPEKLSAATRSRIGQAVDRLGYLPSGVARGLAERRTGMVALYSFSQHEPDELARTVHGEPGIVERITEHGRPPRLFPLFSDEVLRGVELECTIRRLPLVVGWQAADDRGVELDDIAGRGDGVIVLPSTVADDHLRRLSRHKPVVLVSQPVPEGIAASSVSVDNEGGVREVTAHLADDHGARTFWYAGTTQGPELEARLRGFEAALGERGLQARPSRWCRPARARGPSRRCGRRLRARRRCATRSPTRSSAPAIRRRSASSLSWRKWASRCRSRWP